ncbi:MAG: hypothetical protein REI45_05330, partial [Propionicimonas sp.]|nr:hypothetical protein [Propionicimonas sp.]
MTTQGLAEFRDRYEALLVAACEWRAMQADPEVLAARVFTVLEDRPAAPDLRTLVVGVTALQYDAADGLAAYNTVLAGANIALIPLVVVFVALQ